MFVNRLAILTREIIRMEEMEKGYYQYPNRNYNRNLSLLTSKMESKRAFFGIYIKNSCRGSCTAIAKKMKIDPIIPALTANK